MCTPAPIILARSRRPHERGYALVLTLVLLAIAVTAVTDGARRVASRAADVARAESQLRQSWAERSFHAVLLPRAEQVLAQAEAESPTPLRSVTHVLELRGLDVTVRFTDEQARLNVNALQARTDRSQAELAVRRLEASSPISFDTRVRNVRLRPDLRVVTGKSNPQPASDRRGTQAGAAGLDAEVSSPILRPYLALDQIYETFEDVGVPDLPVTCWGDGRLHLRRASNEGLEQACFGVLTPGEIDALLALRTAQPGLAVSRISGPLGLAREQRSELLVRLTDRSECFGLWVQIDDGARRHLSLAVSDQRGGTTRTEVFRW